MTKDKDGFARFSGENIQYPGKSGSPAIPYLIIKALLPPNADLSTVKILMDEKTVQSNRSELPDKWKVRPIPVLATWDGTKVVQLDAQYDDSAFKSSEDFPGAKEIIKPLNPGSKGGWLLADIPIAMFQYNPATETLYRLNFDQVVINFDLMQKIQPNSINLNRLNKEKVKNITVNFDQIAPDYSQDAIKNNNLVPQASAGYVIITTNAIVAGSTQLSNFVTHKQNLGHTVSVVTEGTWGGGTGNTAAENIRTWLQNNYIGLNIEYVLLIGNPNPSTGNVPMKMLWPRNNATWETTYKESPSDYYYADLTGDWDLDNDGKYGEGDDDTGPGGIDKHYEVIVGRIPYYGSLTDLDCILAKTIAYQSETDIAWRSKALLPMEPSDASTPGWHLGEEIKNAVLVPNGLGYHRVYEADYGLIPPPETTPCTVANTTAAWNGSEFGAVFWWTHGSETSAAGIMDLTSAATLDDTHPVFTFQCSCLNAHPETTNNLTYSLLKNGAIASISATRVSWYSPGQTSFAGTSTNSGMTYEYAKRLVSGIPGGCGCSLHDMKEVLAYSSDLELWMNFTDFNIYGDPETSLSDRLGPPVAQFGADQTFLLNGSSTTFHDYSSGQPTSWQWTVTPSTVTYLNGTDSTSQNPEIQFNALGFYTVSLYVENAYGNDTETKTDYIEVVSEFPDYFTELFESDNDLDNQALTFTPGRSALNYYCVCRESAASFPTDPSGGTVLPLGDDAYAQVTLTGNTVALYGTAYSSFFVGSNGYVTFGTGTTQMSESLTAHFDRPRISGLFDDLDPNSAGTISWKEETDRAVVTFEGIPQYGGADANSFQIEMFYDGVIRLTHLNIGATDGLAGLSFGPGSTPGDFSESDLSAYSPCLIPGDINGDGYLNLADVIAGLQILAGITPGTEPVIADVNGDSKIGIAEVVYALEKVADER